MPLHRTQLLGNRPWKRRIAVVIVFLATMSGAWKLRDGNLATPLFALQPPPGAKPSGPPQSATTETDLAIPPATTSPIQSTPSNDSGLVAPPGLDLSAQPADPDDPTLATIRDLLLERSQQATGGKPNAVWENIVQEGQAAPAEGTPSSKHWLAIESILKGARLLEAEAIASGQMEIPGSLGHEQAAAARQLRQQARRLLLRIP